MVRGAVPFKGQRYDLLKKSAHNSGHLFIDREFPPDDSSLFFQGSSKTRAITWKRPKVIMLLFKLRCHVIHYFEFLMYVFWQIIMCTSGQF